jgi:hypothetical protein
LIFTICPEKKQEMMKKAVHALPDTAPIMKSNDAALHHSENKYSVALPGDASSGLEAMVPWAFPEPPVDTVDRCWGRRLSTQEALGVACGRLRALTAPAALQPLGSWMNFSPDGYKAGVARPVSYDGHLSPEGLA